jgi:hypothetical protein
MNIIVDLSCPIFKYGENSIYVPLEIAYIIFNEEKISEIFSTRIKYDLTIYPKSLWENMFYFYVSKFPSMFRTHYFYEKYKLEKHDVNTKYMNKLKMNDSSIFYKDDYGLTASQIKNTLIKKIKKYNLNVYAKNITRLNHFLDAENNEIKINELKNLGMPKYSNLIVNNKIKFIDQFYKINKNLIKINYEIFDKKSIFSLSIIKDLVESEIPIYKVIVFYILYKKFNLN